MIKTLASLGSNAARFVYTFMKANGGACTRQQILQAGLKRTQADEVFITLQNNNLLIRVSVGYYRLVDTAPAVESTAGAVLSDSAESENPKSTAPAVQNTAPAVESTAGAVLEDLTESASSKPYRNRKSTARAVQSTAGAVDSTARAVLSGNPVNVNVNMNLTNKQTKGISIKTTSEISDFWAEIEGTEKKKFYQATCIKYENMLKAKEIYDVSRDLTLRIILAEKLLGKKITIDHINNWAREARKAEKEHRVKKAYMAFAKSVKIFYEKQGVTWTKCRPNNLIEADETLIKAESLQTNTEEQQDEELDIESLHPVLQEIAKHSAIPRKHFVLNFGCTETKEQNGTLFIECRNRFSLDCIKKHYGSLLDAAAAKHNLRCILRATIQKVDALNTPVTIAGMPTGETIAGMLTDGAAKTISMEDAKRMLEADDPPYREKKKARD